MRFTLPLLLLTVVASTAVGAPYTFTSIVDSSGSYGNFLPGVTINSAGQVAFWAGRDSGGLEIGKYSLGQVTTIAQSPAAGILGPPSMNEAGTIAYFQARTPGVADGIHVSKGPTLLAGTPEFQDFRPWVSINDSDVVAFVGIRSSHNQTGVYLATYNGPIQEWFRTPGWQDIGQAVSISNEGTVLFGLQDDVVALIVLLNENGGIIIADDGGLSRPFVNFGPVAFGPSGVLSHDFTGAFTALLNDGREAVFISNGDYDLLAATGPEFAKLRYGESILGPINSVTINESETVAFMGQLNDGRNGIFVVPDDGTYEPVIMEGANLFGSTVQELIIDRESLADNGRIAFIYRLDNGVSGVAIATPVPEPSTMMLCGVGLVGLIAIRQRTK